jgi:hypothetical protein
MNVIDCQMQRKISLVAVDSVHLAYMVLVNLLYRRVIVHRNL